MRSYSILIICWDLPPNKGIGGRRWAKMAKSFLKLGAKVAVLNRANKVNKFEPVWISKEVFSSLEMYSIKENVFVKWLNDYSSPFRSFRIRFAKLALSFISKGTIYDKAIGIEDRFLKTVSNIIEKNKLELICVTGAPFNLLYYCAKLKKKFPNIKIVADYRDPWMNAQNYGMKNLSYNRKVHELEKQDLVFENVDLVTAPNLFLLNEIKATYAGGGTIKAQFTELSHAFDPDDVVLTKEKKGTNGVNIVYAGALYIGCEPYLQLLNDSVIYFLQHSKNADLKINIYTDDVNKGKIFASSNDHIIVSPSIHTKVFDEINSSDLIIILLSEHNKNYVTSKFYEFLPYKKPFLYLGPKGYVYQKIKDEKLGFCLDKKEDLLTILSSEFGSFSKDLDLSKYTFDHVASDLLTKVMNAN